MTSLIDQPAIREEQFANEGTGVEVETADEGSGIRKPWDPELIRVSTKSFSLRNVVDMIDANDLDLAPDFQRNQVWKPKQKSRLIESLLLQIPLPAFYFAEDGEGLLRVVDGLQRLSTVHAFTRGESFQLRDLEYLSDEEGKTFTDLTQSLQRRLWNTQIVVHVIDPVTPDGVKYDIFKRINTGGDPLNSMEIRHCMSKTRSRKFLKALTEVPEFNEATGGVLRNHVRMNDREAVLRFAAFLLPDSLARYEDYGSLEDLLNAVCARIDDESDLSDSDLAAIAESFELAMKNAMTVFGQHAFRKWRTEEERLWPINRALFESWGVELARHDARVVKRHKDAIQAAARRAMTSDLEYVASISTSTSDSARVRKRFELPRLVIEDVLNQ